jgi:hypothetical protein
MSIFRSLSPLRRESVQVRGSGKCFVTFPFYGEVFLVHARSRCRGCKPLLAVRGCLFNIFPARGRPSVRTPRTDHDVATEDPPGMACLRVFDLRNGLGSRDHSEETENV